MVSRIRRRLLCLAALPVLALAGCDLGTTEPVSISLQFPHNHTLNTDGSCQVQFIARAFGYGTAEWSRVVIRESNTVVREYVGAEVREFWGDTEISAGEEQRSTPFLAQDAAENVQIDVMYRVIGPERTVELNPSCAGDGEGS